VLPPLRLADCNNSPKCKRLEGFFHGLAANIPTDCEP
jgi:hypothetical protein